MQNSKSKKRQFLILVFVVFCAFVVNAQVVVPGVPKLPGLTQINSDKINILGVEYKVPDDFSGYHGENFESTPKLSNRLQLSFFGDGLKSNDGHCVIFTEMNAYILSNAKIDHLKYVRAIAKYSYGKSWKRHVKYYPKNETKLKFNADLALICIIPLEKDEYYKDKYKFCKVLRIEKNDRGFIELFCFYDDEAYGNYCMSTAEKLFRFNEAKPTKTSLTQPNDGTILIDFGRGRPVKMK